MGLQNSFEDTNQNVPVQTRFRKACHLPFQLEHKAYWVIQKMYFDVKACGEKKVIKIE